MDTSLLSFISRKSQQVFGSKYSVLSMDRLLGGAQKHTYHIKTSADFEFVLYIWDTSTTYFASDESSSFTSNSSELFELNNKIMADHGIHVQKLYYMDRSRKECDFEYAFAQYIDGIDMDELIAKHKDKIEPALASLNQNLRNIHKIKSKVPGQLNHLLSSDYDLITSSKENAQKNLEYLKVNDSGNINLYNKITKALNVMSLSLSARDNYTFIHGELGPNHVIVDKNNTAYLIDIEGAKFCDVEEEESFLKIRFGQYYDLISEKNPSKERMDFYNLCHSLGNLSGAIELKLKDYYDMDDINGMIDFFTKELNHIAINYNKKLDEY